MRGWMWALVLMACESAPAAVSGPVVPTGPKCSQQMDCTTEQVCAQAVCQPLFPHDWKLTLQKAEFQEYADDGNGWDDCPAGGKDKGCPPDGQARVYLDGKLVCDTGITADSYAPAWNKTCTVRIDHQSKLQIKLTEHDDAVDAVASDWNATGAAMASELRNRSLKTDGQNPVFVAFEPL